MQNSKNLLPPSYIFPSSILMSFSCPHAIAITDGHTITFAHPITYDLQENKLTIIS